MPNETRENLINALKESVGLKTQTPMVAQSGSWYDASTGTLYCGDNLVITKNIAEKASNHFSILARQCNMEIPEERQLAMFYRCAVEAIAMMEDEDVRKTLLEKVKKA